jgi:hypothetical protein
MALGSQGFDIPLHGQGTDLERPSDFFGRGNAVITVDPRLIRAALC